MKRQLESILLVGGIFIFFVGFGVAWLLFGILDPDYTLYILGGTIILTIVFGLILNSLIQSYIFGTRQLNEETKVIFAANKSHRIQPEGPKDIRMLAETINVFADRFQETVENQAAQITQSQAALEDEKNRLAALMSELTEGVLVCNLEGRILLYNNRAKDLLQQRINGTWPEQVGGFVGLGRSVFALVGRNTITQALEELTYRLEKDNANLVTQFVTTATNGQLIRSRIAPVLAQHNEMNGFILTLEDITQQSQRSFRRDRLLQTLTEGVRAALANIRTAIETIELYPEMDANKLAQLRKVIYDEALTLSAKLQQITSEHDRDLKSDWQLEEMLGSDLLWALQRRFEDRLNIITTVYEPDDNLWIKVDSYIIVQAMTHLVERLKAEFQATEVSLRLKKNGHLSTFDLVWASDETDMDSLWSWQNEPLHTDEAESRLTLRDVAERHGGEVWCQADPETNTAYFRLLLPTIKPKHHAAPKLRIQSSRPEYYDFDLFHQPDQTPELDQRSLSELTYTVFDTETTGLNPSAGDEIISVSAMRIVNGRLLREEIFDYLVDPQREVSAEATNVHGISSEMLQGKPKIAQVLPMLHGFMEGTVLVAHNAAFDMRLLQLKEASTGIRFTNPVMDTLLLSAVLHPNDNDHSLEAMAQRFGINVFGRHTSLGDTMLTGEIFLKFIPLLAEQGIVTLGQARRAAEKTYYARFKY